MEQVVAAAPPSPRSINPAIPSDLETIVLKAIARDPAMRYATATEMADDLRRYQEDRPIAARRASQFEQAWRWCRRNPAVATLMASLLLVFGIGAGASAFFAARAEKNEAEARHNADEAQENARLATQREREATDGKEELRREQEQTRRLLYASQMQQASAAYNDDRIPRLEQLFQETNPKPGERDIRGWEWHFLYRQIRPQHITDLHVEISRPAYFRNAAIPGSYLLDYRQSTEGYWFELWDIALHRKHRSTPAGWNHSCASQPNTSWILPMEGYRTPTTSVDGKFALMRCPSLAQNSKGLRLRIRLWEIASVKELSGPTKEYDEASSNFKLGPNADWIAWVESSKTEDGVTPPGGDRTTQPYTVVRWTRCSGQTQRWQIDPQPRLVDLSIAEDCRSVLVLPSKTLRLGAKPRDFAAGPQYRECWDLGGTTAKLRWKFLPQNLVLENSPNWEMSVESPGMTMHAIVEQSNLVVYRLSDGTKFWQAPLPLEGARKLQGISDDGLRVLFADNNTLKIFDRSGTNVRSPVHQWTIRHIEPWGLGRAGGALGGLYLTPDGKSLIFSRYDKPSQSFRVSIADIAYDPQEYRSPSNEFAQIEQVTTDRETSRWDRLVESIIRDGRGREIGRIPPLPSEGQFTRSADLASNGRRVVVATVKRTDYSDYFNVARFNANSWKLHATDSPGEMKLIASGTGSLINGRNVDNRWMLSVGSKQRERPGQLPSDIVSIAVRGYETGQSIGTIELPEGEELSNALELPLENRLLTATRPILRITKPEDKKNSRPRKDRTQVQTATLRLYDPANQPRTLELANRSGNVLDLRIAPQPGSPTYVCQLGDDGRRKPNLKVRLADGTLELEMKVASDRSPVVLLSFAPDGRLAIGLRDQIQLWDAGSGKLSQRFPGHDDLYFPYFTADGARMFVSTPLKIHVWDTITGRELISFPHQVKSMALLHRFEGGKLIVKPSHSLNGSVTLREFDCSPVPE